MTVLEFLVACAVLVLAGCFGLAFVISSLRREWKRGEPLADGRRRGQ